VAVLGQAVLGIVTLIHGAPAALALAHQAGAVAVVSLILRARFLAGWPRIATIAGRLA